MDLLNRSTAELTTTSTCCSRLNASSKLLESYYRVASLAKPPVKAVSSSTQTSHVWHAVHGTTFPPVSRHSSPQALRQNSQTHPVAWLPHRTAGGLPLPCLPHCRLQALQTHRLEQPATRLRDHWMAGLKTLLESQHLGTWAGTPQGPT